MQPVKVSAVVLTYNGWDLLDRCLPTVIAQDWPDLEILVVDNGSQDDIPAKLMQHYPEVQVLALPKNLGFAGANNAGVEHTTGDYIALISNDVRLPSNFIRRLVEALQDTPQAAVAGPHVHNLNMDMTLYPFTGSMSLSGSVIQNVFKDNSLTFGAAGCSLMFRREWVGLPFDSDYQFFHEEIYLAWRARLRGYTVLRLPEVIVEHIGSASVGYLSDENRFLLERNRCLNYLTLFSQRTRLRVFPLLLLSRLWERVGDWKAGRSWQPIRRARRWFKENKFLWLVKRASLQAERRVADSEIVCWMSYKITNQTGVLGNWVNGLAYLWCVLSGLKTWERVGKSKGVQA